MRIKRNTRKRTKMTKIVEREKFVLELRNKSGKEYHNVVRYVCSNLESPISAIYVAKKALPSLEDGSPHTITVVLDE